MKTAFHFFLAALMLITGTINTLATKYADIACAKGVSYFYQEPQKDDACNVAEGYHQFDHPFFQALTMFIGEFLCMLAFKLILLNASRQGKPSPIDLGPQDWSVFIFLVPAMCDCAATSLMYLGLTLTFASQYQMLRGSVVIFTGLMSKFILKRQLQLYHWLGMLFVLIGLVFVGLAALLFVKTDSNAKNPILGDVLIVAAQVIVSLQMVAEEKFIEKYRVPALQVVGWEGIFGMGIMSFLCIIFYYIPGDRAGDSFENVNDGMYQIGNSWVIRLAIAGSICSIALFNYSGVSVTKEMSATTRMVLDSVRTITIWVYGMIVGWEKFQYLQIIGFFFLLSGTFIYNNILVTPILIKLGVVKPQLKSLDSRKLDINGNDDEPVI